MTTTLTGEKPWLVDNPGIEGDYEDILYDLIVRFEGPSSTVYIGSSKGLDFGLFSIACFPEAEDVPAIIEPERDAWFNFEAVGDAISWGVIEGPRMRNGRYLKEDW